MNELSELLKEAFTGVDPYDADPRREGVEAALQRFDGRVRTVRWMAWIGVGFLFAVAVVTLVLLLRAPDDASPRTLSVYVALFVWANVGIGMAKLWFAMMLNDIGIRRELKRMQLVLLELREERG